ncbi:aspartate 1-decarboxylase [Bradyrhizobium sp. USDA 3650]
MQIISMKGKIHRVWVTGADLDSDGSVSNDRALLDAAGLLIHERVEIYKIESRGASRPMWWKPPADRAP